MSTIITSNQHSIGLARAAAAAFMLGRTHELAESLHRSGFNEQVDADMLRLIGSDYASLWGVNDKARTRCFHCAAPTRPGRLCECYETALPRQLVAFEKEVLSVLPPGAPAISYICSGCGVHAATPVRDVLRLIAAGRPFKGHTLCNDCHADRRRAAPKPAKRPLQAKLRDVAALHAPQQRGTVASVTELHEQAQAQSQEAGQA